MTKWSKERGVGSFGARASCQLSGCQMSKDPTGCYHKSYVKIIVNEYVNFIPPWPRILSICDGDKTD